MTEPDQRGASVAATVGDLDRVPYTCQGCGTVRYGTRWHNQPHACWRNDDGSYEEGGTFQ